MRKMTGKWNKIAGITGLLFGSLCFLASGSAAEAKVAEHTEVPSGVTVNGKDLSGTAMEDLGAELESIAQTLSQGKVTLSIDGNEVETSLKNLGIEMDLNKTEEKIKSVGNKGNIVVRYKALKDAEAEGLPLGISLKWEEASATAVLNKTCGKYEEPAVNFGLTHENGQFTVVEGKAGFQVSKEKARKLILKSLGKNWDGSDITIALELESAEPKGSAEELAQVKDLLGECSTSYATSSSDRAKNVERGASLVHGTVLYPGEKCSFYELVAPIQVDNGYFMAPSYASGQVVESPGGGICQVSTTLYGALLQAELEINERSNHSMLVNYVEPSMDAAIAGTYKDLKFTNNLDAPVYIEAQTAGRKLSFRVFGKENRPANRRIEYKSVELESIEPAVVLEANWEAGAGSISKIESEHRGCKAKLVKSVYVDDKLVEEVDVNTSNYRMTPKKLSVGVVTENAELCAALQAAISANDLDSVNAALSTYGVGTNPTQGEGAPAGQEGAATGAAIDVAPDAAP